MSQHEEQIPNLVFIKNGFNIESADISLNEEIKTNLEHTNTLIKFDVKTSKETVSKNKLDIFDDNDDDGSHNSPIIDQKQKLSHMNVILDKSKTREIKGKNTKNLNENNSSENKSLSRKEKIDSLESKNDKRSSKKKSHDKYDYRESSKKTRKSHEEKNNKNQRRSLDSRDHSKEKKGRERQRSRESSKEKSRNSNDFTNDKKRYSDKKNKDDDDKNRRRIFEDSLKPSNYSKRRERHSDPKHSDRRLLDNHSYGDRKRYSDSFNFDRRDAINERNFIRPRTPDKHNVRRSLEIKPNRTHSISYSDSLNNSESKQKNTFTKFKPIHMSQNYRKNLPYRDKQNFRCKNRPSKFSNNTKRKFVKHLDNNNSMINDSTSISNSCDSIDNTTNNDNNIVESDNRDHIELMYDDLDTRKSPLSSVTSIIADNNNLTKNENSDKIPIKSFSKIKDHKTIRKIIHPDIGVENNPDDNSEIDLPTTANNSNQSQSNKHISVGKYLDINHTNDDLDLGDTSDLVDDESYEGNISDSSSGKTTSMRLSIHDNDHTTPLMDTIDQPKLMSRGYPLVSEIYSDDELVDIDIGLLTSISQEYRSNLKGKFILINSKSFFIRLQQLIYETLKKGLPGVSFDVDRMEFNFNMRFLPDCVVLSIEKLVTHYLNKQKIY